jgi:hypothetical protein
VPEEDPGLRQSFGSIADGYDRFRPGPPEEAVQWALDPFAEPERQVIRWTRLMAKEDLVGMAGTYSAIITMPVVERDLGRGADAMCLLAHDPSLNAARRGVEEAQRSGC